MQINDMLGNAVVVGDCIAYPSRRGSFIWQNVMRITAIFEECGDHTQPLRIQGVRLIGDGRAGDRTTLGANGVDPRRRIIRCPVPPGRMF